MEQSISTVATNVRPRIDRLLEVTNLSIAFPGADGSAVYPVRGVHLAISSGQRLALVGESGSGKSLTGLAIMRLVRPPGQITSGKVALRGRSLLDLSPREMAGVRGRQVAMIYQDPNTALNPVMSIGRQVVEALRAHHDMSSRAAKARAIDMLKEAGLQDAMARFYDYPHQFSGGMRQRVMIAISLVAEPEVLVADECTTALDVTTQALIIRLLAKLVDDRGTAVLFITHNLDLAADFCSDIKVMYAGRIIESASVAELKAAPLHPYSEGLLRSVCRLDSPADRPLVAISGQPPDAKGQWEGCPFAPRCSYAFARCRLREPSLDQVGLASPRRAACYLAAERAKGAAA